jgi:acyl carrier protein
MMARDDLVARLLAWLNDNHPSRDVTVTATTPLFASGLVDSLKILELLAWTERAIGRRVHDSEITLENFHSAQRIADVFASEVTHVLG